MRTNPNGANQYQLDPRQKLCWDYYVNPKSETFSSGLQSALKAGYEQSTAEHITLEDWFIEKLRTLNMLDKAERNLNDFLDIIEDTDTKVRVKADITKFIAERVGKAVYSTRTEVDHTTLGEPIKQINYIIPNEPDGINNTTNVETTSSVSGS